MCGWRATTAGPAGHRGLSPGASAGRKWIRMRRCGPTIPASPGPLHCAAVASLRVAATAGSTGGAGPLRLQRLVRRVANPRTTADGTSDGRERAYKGGTELGTAQSAHGPSGIGYIGTRISGEQAEHNHAVGNRGGSGRQYAARSMQHATYQYATQHERCNLQRRLGTQSTPPSSAGGRRRTLHLACIFPLHVARCMLHISMLHVASRRGCLTVGGRSRCESTWLSALHAQLVRITRMAAIVLALALPPL